MLDSLQAFLAPPELSFSVSLALIGISFITSALTAAVGIGGGLALLAVLATLISPAAVIPVHGVVQLGSNAGRAMLLRRHAAGTLTGLFALGSIVGAVIGGQLVVTLPSGVLQLILGLFILYAVWAPKFRASAVPLRGYLLVGAAATFVTMFIGATGPFIAAFISPDRLSRHAVVATHAACMTVQHALKVLVFGLLGFAFLPWLPLLAAMIASGFLGTIVGRKALDRLPEKSFGWIFKAVLTLLAARLLYAALTSADIAALFGQGAV